MRFAARVRCRERSVRRRRGPARRHRGREVARAAVRFNVMLAVPVFVWHDHVVAVIAPIMFMKKLFWLSLVVSTGAVVVLSEPAM